MKRETNARKAGKLLWGLFLVQGVSMACTPAQQSRAAQLYQQAYTTDIYDQQIGLLERSLQSCYSAVVAADKYLREGDDAYDKGSYEKAGRSYNQIMQEVDKITNPEDKQKYRLLYYERMEEVYESLGKSHLARTMEKKYLMAAGEKGSASIHKSYVASKDIYRQLSPSDEEKDRAFRGMGIVEKKINLSINFDYDSSRLSRSGTKQAEALGEASRKILRENPDGKIEITGYTDTDGSADYNLNLSERRAETIKRFLSENYGVNDSQLNYRGRGEQSPTCLDGNKGSESGRGEHHCQAGEDKEASRRVEVTFSL